jgi:predicted metal-dependent hydrolase
MSKRDKKRDRKVFSYVHDMLMYFAAEFQLPLKEVKLVSHKENFYGDCNKEGRIRIQVRRKGVGPLLAYQIVDTMAHELAHLRHLNHSWKWFFLYAAILHRMSHGNVYAQLRRKLK